MARFCACCSFCQNLLPVGKDEFAGVAPTENSGTPKFILIMLFVPICALATAPIAGPYLDNELFMHFIKAFLKTQVPAQTVPEIDLKPCE